MAFLEEETEILGRLARREGFGLRGLAGRWWQRHLWWRRRESIGSARMLRRSGKAMLIVREALASPGTRLGRATLRALLSLPR